MSVARFQEPSNHWYAHALAWLTRVSRGRAPSPGSGHSTRRTKMLVLLSLSALILLVGLFPPILLSDKFAEIVPAAWVRTASEQAQNQLDQAYLRPSRAPRDRIETITTRFASLTAPASGAQAYSLIFRDAGQSGALIYSLPNGMIVLSDQIVSALPDDKEVFALLCHELGHVYYRHALRASIQRRFLPLGVVSLLNLESRAIALLARGFLDSPLADDSGNEADEYARKMLRANGITADKLDSALMRLRALSNPARTSSPLILHSTAEAP